jgi:hypothetical protein
MGLKYGEGKKNPVIETGLDLSKLFYLSNDTFPSISFVPFESPTTTK